METLLKEQSDLKQQLKKSILITCLVFVFCGLLYDRITQKVNISDRYIENGNIIVVLDGEGQCYIGDDLNGAEWVRSDENNVCVMPLIDKGNIYIRNKYNHLCETLEDQKFSYVESIKINYGTVYLAIDGKEKVTYTSSLTGVVDEPVVFSSDNEQIATVDSDGTVHGLSKGKANLTVTYGDKQDSVEIIVTDLITTMAPEYDMEKPFLPCGVFSKEDNDLMDEILFSRVEKAGYHTRAGAVAAGRFLAMEFPYRINYFTENGRMGSCRGNYIDGEGRYYHRGLYLDPSRYENINMDYTMSGPAPWGCTIYEASYNRNAANGLDCSGSMTWILVQAGYDPGDIGAGITPWCLAMADLGERIWLADAYDNKTLKVGDLLSGGDGGPEGGGHIAMCVGIDKEGYVYVAEELGYHYYWGYMIRKYDRAGLLHYFYWQVDMDEFYGEDGNLTDYWIEE
ncbi:MAG: Ig-like domain-containing protein [Erysipelotrichaceae bacterium]|nr:Ig-like domain-containing protein [Erysipelotrichaceae bacterium]